MKIHVTKAFRPYTIEIITSKDHQDLLRMLSDAMTSYNRNTVGYQDLNLLRESLIKTQSGTNEAS